MLADRALLKERVLLTSYENRPIFGISNLKKPILATYINERIFVIICSFLKPLGVLGSLVRLLRKPACGDYKTSNKSSVKTVL